MLKPFAYTDFLKAAQKALQWFELSSGTSEMHSPDKSYIFVKSDYKLKQIPLDKVLYIEGLKDYVKIYLEDEPHPILSLLSLKSLEEMLPDSRFIRVHRSFIVQGCKIKMIDRNCESYLAKNTFLFRILTKILSPNLSPATPAIQQIGERHKSRSTHASRPLLRSCFKFISVLGSIINPAQKGTQLSDAQPASHRQPHVSQPSVYTSPTRIGNHFLANIRHRTVQIGNNKYRNDK